MAESMISKAVNLLSLIAKAEDPMTFSKLVNESGLNKTTVHRILKILIDEEMIQFHTPKKVYLLGSRAFDMIKQAQGTYDIKELSKDVMLDLQKLTDQNVSIQVMDGNDVLVLETIASTNSFGTDTRPGLREPLHVCGSGKAIVAFLPKSDFDAKFKNYEFLSRASNTVSTLEQLEADLVSIRKQGYALTYKEEYEHICGISAPIFDYNNEVVASMNIWGTVSNISLNQLESYANVLIEKANQVTELIGGRSKYGPSRLRAM